MAAKGKVTEPTEPDPERDLPTSDELLVRVYDELRRLARNYLRRERVDHTLQPTALVHEAYLRLAAQNGVSWRNREHFVSVAAQMMRRVLIDHARGHTRDKRGGRLKLAIAEIDRVAQAEGDDLIALDEALQRFARLYPQKSRIVELRFFGGLSIEETAGVLQISDSTVERDWKFARAWLARELNHGISHE